jgi:hypothetical protein
MFEPLKTVFTKSGWLSFIIKAGYENFIGLPKGKGTKNQLLMYSLAPSLEGDLHTCKPIGLPKAISLAPRGQLQRGNGFRFLWFVFITLSLTFLIAK